MRAVEAMQHFAFVVTDFHAGDSTDKSVLADFGRGQRLKLFNCRKQIGETRSALATCLYPSSVPFGRLLTSGPAVAVASA